MIKKNILIVKMSFKIVWLYTWVHTFIYTQYILHSKPYTCSYNKQSAQIESLNCFFFLLEVPMHLKCVKIVIWSTFLLFALKSTACGFDHWRVSHKTTAFFSLTTHKSNHGFYFAVFIKAKMNILKNRIVA